MNCKRPEQFPVHVTALISEQLTKSLLDKYPLPKMDKQFLQKAELDLKPHRSSNTSNFFGKCTSPKQFTVHVTTLISEQLTKSLLDKYPLAKLDKQFLQKAELKLPLEETDPEPDNVLEGT